MPIDTLPLIILSYCHEQNCFYFVSIVRTCVKQVMEEQQRAAAVAKCRSAAQAERL